MRIAHEDCLKMEIYDTHLEAKVLIEQWCREYNTVRLHRSLGYVPSAPEAIQPCHLASLRSVIGPWLNQPKP